MCRIVNIVLVICDVMVRRNLDKNGGVLEWVWYWFTACV